MFLIKSQLLIVLMGPCTYLVIFLFMLTRFFSVFAVESLAMVCLGVVLFVFILFEIHWTSKTYRFDFFKKDQIWYFWARSLLKKFFSCLFLSFWDSRNDGKLVTETLLTFLQPFFSLSFKLDNFYWCVLKGIDFLLPSWVHFWALIVNYLFL